MSAATSLTQAFTEIAEQFTQSRVQLNFGASSALADAIVEGAAVDVFASADEATMTKLRNRKLVDGRPVTFAHNKLVIVTKPGNPTGITTLNDLVDGGVISLCAVEAPCGQYAAQALASASVTIDESRITRGQNVAATLDAVAEGDAVAGVVYVTDAQSKPDRVDTVEIPDEQNVVASYPIATIAPVRRTAANAFVEFVRGETGQRILRKYGFLP